jgi:hypothetical protein
MLILFLSVAAININEVSATPYYSYVLNGPYKDTLPTSIMTGTTATVTLAYTNSTISTFYLNSTTPSYNITSNTPITTISWNASSALNYTRLINPQPLTTTQTINIFSPDSTVPAYFYFFPITDFVGMSNAYLRTSISTGSAIYMIEQRNLADSGTPSFLLQQYKTYTFTFICDQGTFSQTYTAENTFSTTLQVTTGMFETNTTTLTASAERSTNSTILINYFDPSSQTTIVTITVTHTVGTSIITDFSDTGTNSYKTLLTVYPTIDYTVKIVALSNGVVSTWTLSCPAPITTVNPFTGLFDFLGTWPPGLDPAQLLGAFIILCCLSVGSFKTTGFSCVVAWIVTGILMLMGLYTMGIPTFAFAGVLSIWIAISEAKQTQGE